MTHIYPLSGLTSAIAPKPESVSAPKPAAPAPAAAAPAASLKITGQLAAETLVSGVAAQASHLNHNVAIDDAALRLLMD